MHYKIVGIVPPSTRSAAPLFAAARGLTRYVTNVATSSIVANRLIRHEGLTVSKNSRSISSMDLPFSLDKSEINFSAPSDLVEPGITELTVTFVPEVCCARPLATPSWAVFVVP